VETLDIHPNDEVYLVSDISRLMMNAVKHEKGFSATAFIDSFINHVPQGRLYIPGFVNTLQNNVEVDMRTLKPETGGLSKEAFSLFKKGKCKRTNDPFHSFFVFGKNAEEVLEYTNDSDETFGKKSVFGFLHQNNGVMILMDLQLYYGFTFAHYVEQQLQVKYRKLVPNHFRLITAEGIETKKTIQVFSKKKGYLPVLNGLEEPLIKEGAMKIYQYNGVKIFKINLQKAFEVIENDILVNKAQNLIDFNLSLYLKQTIKKITAR